ncbi:MAG: diadenylate cyclase CdaA [Fibrobacterales bacterium]
MNDSYKILDIIPFGITDLIDLSIVTIFLYYLFILFRGTRAVQMFWGFVMLFVLYTISTWWDLVVLSWLFSTLLKIGFLSIVVIFQPELRGGLTRIGSMAGSLSLRKIFFHPNTYHDVIKEIIETAEDLSLKKFGALMVIEQNVGLKNYTDTGIKMNAAVTSQLLKTIFFPNTPLHDGAVIIHGDRIRAAGCTLPIITIQEDSQISNKVGMRHKAAKALTNESDAVVVIVSEETGYISLAYRNKLLLNISSKQIEEKIHAIIEETQDQ